MYRFHKHSKDVILYIVKSWLSSNNVFMLLPVRSWFKRIVSKDPFETCLDGLDDLVSSLLEVNIATSVTGKKQTLEDILNL